MCGWIKLHRKICAWGWYKDTNTKVVFLHLLLNANHKDGEFLGIKIFRGTIVSGRKSLAKDLGLSEMQVRTALKKLEISQEITIKTTNRFSIITICNYDIYQGLDDVEQQAEQPTDNQQITNRQPTDNQQITTNKNVRRKECKKERKEEVVFSPVEETLQSFVEYRASIKKKLSPASIKAIKKKAEKYGLSTFEEVVTKTIENGWTGLFWPDAPEQVKKEPVKTEAEKAQCEDDLINLLRERKHGIETAN